MICQVSNDSLSLRQPVRVTCLAHAYQSTTNIHVGTQLGHLRRYDTRAARKPVADYKDVLRKGNGIEAVETGLAEQCVVPAVCASPSC